jgi:hypothetical protein
MVVSPMQRPPLPPRKYSRYLFLLETESTIGPQCDQKDYVNSNDTIGNRTRHLPDCSAVSQPTVLPLPPAYAVWHSYIHIMWDKACELISSNTTTMRRLELFLDKHDCTESVFNNA